jgi:hypothetical protein
MMANSEDDWGIRLFLFSPGGIISVAIVSFVFWASWAFSDREILIASLAIDDATFAYIYEDNFCDQARIPFFRIYINGKSLPGTYGTSLWLECGHEFKAESFRVVAVEAESMCGVFYDWGGGESLAFAYDKQKQVPVPSESTEKIPERTETLLYEAAAATYSDRRTKR